MRRTILGLLTALAVATGSTLVAAPAEAAPKPVTIKKIPTASIGWNGTAVVKPVVKKAKKVKIIKKTLTVRQGSKVLRKNRTAVKLKPGTYRVTTKVVYKHRGKKRTKVATQRLQVKQGRCATKADYRSIKVKPTSRAGDATKAVARKLHQSGQLMSNLTGPITLGELRDLNEEFGGLDDETTAAFDALIALFGEDAVVDMGLYGICQNTKKEIAVMYIDGHAVDKSVDSVS